MGRKAVSKKENLFAASRFVLPEHREIYLQMKQEQVFYVPPQLDEHQRAELASRLWQAFQEKQEVEVTCYDRRGPRQVRGVILHMEQVTRRIKLRTDQGTEWISVDHLLDVGGGG
ncbi:YolD-like family protein [Brevibacillus humidisoli]|uniref:YolD-like family protein n=1 Tax=Brevibacillus humidisoli TaxID=2895522 RepID=UPI001E2A3B41|nr:YolD-like family protein [Brevibacillus humidisoli]UFJ42009.1 YolD-like family protein [Brevibacillus humidisoli]